VLDRLDAGVGVVDGRRQRLVGDVDQPADAEADVLHHGPLEAGAARRQADRLHRRLGAPLLRLPVAGPVGVDVVDHRDGLALDLAHDGVDLDRVGQVVDEVDQHPDAGQGQRPGDGQAGDERFLAGALDPDRVEPGGRVGEGAHEDAQHQLGAPVAHEVAQQARRVLVGGDLEGDDGQGEHQAGDRDHGRRDHDQQRAASSAVPWKARAARGEPSSISTRDSTAPARASVQVHPGPYPGGRVATNSS
jgi:hypothetical protein